MLTIIALTTALAAGGCGGVTVGRDGATTGSDSVKASTAPTGSSAASASSSSGQESARGPWIPGYRYGDFPPIPLIALPDLTMLDTSLGGFSVKVAELVGSHPGLTVGPARCDQAGKVVAGNGSMQLYGDGSGNYTGADGTMQNFGDGSGNYSINGVEVQVFGDGSGNYTNGDVRIQSFGDGSGNFTDGRTTIQIFGDGSGNYTDGTKTIQNFGDGSGNYTSGTLTIQNFGDGAGNYKDSTLEIQNFGDGTGKVNGASVKLDKIPTVPRLGTFPKMGTIRPITSCGTTITLSDAVLFDFDKSELRPEAAPVLESLAKAMTQLKVTAGEVGGHTDAIGDDSYNDALSLKRAESVLAALIQRGVGTGLTPQGHGEAQPVAPNELNGQDNPAGRQLNRRVEIFIPTAGAGQ